MHVVEQLHLAHYVYLLGIAVVLLTMAFRANVVVPSMAATTLVTLAYTANPVKAICSIFNASFVAAGELFNIFLVIALVTALMGALKELKADQRMVEPFRLVMTNGHIAYFTLLLATYGLSLFFWPTPATPLVGAVLVPAAIAAGLPPLYCAVAMAIAGQGMALSSDYVIGVAPLITATAANADPALVAHRALILSLVTGAVASLAVYLRARKHMVAPSAGLIAAWQDTVSDSAETIPGSPLLPGDSAPDTSERAARIHHFSRLFAVLTPLSFAAIIVVMACHGHTSWAPELKGNDAAGLVGGTASILMTLATLATHGPRRMLDATAAHVTDGFVFAFKAMGTVLPIAGFFFLGTAKTAAPIFNVSLQTTPDLLFDLVQSIQQLIPHNPIVVAFGILLMGMVVGVDGSGFAGLPLVGGLSGAMAVNGHISAASLAAIGQMGSIWTGGGTLIAWSSLIAIAGIARVNVLDAVRAMLVPVVLGLCASVLTAIALWR